MLIIPAPKFRKHRRPSNPAPLVHEGMLFQGASVGTPETHAYFLAAGDLVWNGTDLPISIMAMTSNGVMESPVAVVSVENEFLELQFPATVAPGAAWAVVGPVTGIAPALAWPQSGTLG